MKIGKLGKIIIVIVALVIAVGVIFIVQGISNKGKFTVTFLANADNVYYYDENGQRKLVPESGIVQEGVSTPEQINTPTFSRAGYNFKGWNSSIYDLDSDKTFKALWEKYNIVVTYNGNGGMIDGKTVVQKSDITDGYDAFEKAPQFVREGYELSWDKTEEEFAQITDSCTVNAVWIPKTYNLTFKDINGNDFANNTMQATFDTLLGEIEVVAPAVDGMKFSHWEDENGLPIDKGITWTMQSDLIVKPCYTDADNFVIFYDLNGGERQSKVYSFDESYQILPVSNPERKGYEFLGWSVNGSEDLKKSGEISIDDAKINGKIADVSLKAIWGGNTYYVNFDAQGGTISDGKALAVVYGQPISGLPTVTKDGYVFVGWMYQGQTVKDGDISYFSENVTLTAKFLYTYKIKFSLTTKVYGKHVERTLVSWGNLPHESGQKIEDIVIDILEGQSLKDVIENFSELPVVNTDPDNNSIANGYKYLGYWKWYPTATSNTSIKIYPDTVFNSQTFKGVLGGGVITIVPACQAYYSPFV